MTWRKNVLPQSSGRLTFFSLDQWVGSPDHILIWFLTIIFVRIEIQSFLKFLRIEVLNGSGGFLSSEWASESKSPDDLGRVSNVYFRTNRRWNKEWGMVWEAIEVIDVFWTLIFGFSSLMCKASLIFLRKSDDPYPIKMILRLDRGTLLLFFIFRTHLRKG